MIVVSRENRVLIHNIVPLPEDLSDKGFVFRCRNNKMDVRWTVGLSLGSLYLHFAHLAILQNILGGLSAAAAGLMIATGVRLLRPHRSHRMALLFAALAFTGMSFVKLPLLIVLLGLAPISVAVVRVANASAS